MIQRVHPLPEIVIVDPRISDYEAWADAAADADFCFCSTGREALEHAPAGAPLWLINAELPDMAGLELIELLRPRLRGKPVFLVADRYDPAYELAALQRGSLHFACKPLPATWLDQIWCELTPLPSDQHEPRPAPLRAAPPALAPAHPYSS